MRTPPRQQGSSGPATFRSNTRGLLRLLWFPRSRTPYQVDLGAPSARRPLLARPESDSGGRAKLRLTSGEWARHLRGRARLRPSRGRTGRPQLRLLQFVLVLDFSECEQNWPIAAFVLGFSPSCSRFWASKVDSEDDDEDEND